MQVASFKSKLEKIVNSNNSLVCVGLDPDLAKLPKSVAHKSEPLFEFNSAIIDATADLVCCFKPNSAFYEALGAEGIKQLKKTCDYILKKYPTVPILLDFKRGDIGNTNQAYANFAFKYLGVDGVTLQPYQGGEALEPFFGYQDKGLFILVKTSNPGSGEFQNLKLSGRPLYEQVTKAAVSKWNQRGNIMLVAGATYPKELKNIRQIAGDNIQILVPGVGSQGGEIKAMLKAGLNCQKVGLIINSSRQIIYASKAEDFASAARQAAQALRDEINKYRM